MNLVSGQTVNQTSPDWSGDGIAAPESLPSVATAGNLIIVAVLSANGSRFVDSIDDDGTTSYTKLDTGGNPQAGDAGSIEQWFGIAAGAGAGQNIVVTLSGASADSGFISISEFDQANADQSGRTDNGAAVAGGTTHNSGDVTPAGSNNVVVACQSRTNGDWTEDTDFTFTLSTSMFKVGYISNAVGATGYNTSSGDNEFSVMRIGAYVGAAAGAKPWSHYANMMGS